MAYRTEQQRRGRRIWLLALLFLLALAVWAAWQRYLQADETLNQTPPAAPAGFRDEGAS